MTTLIISNEKIKDIMKIIKSLEESGLFLKDDSEIIENETKEQNGEFLGMLFGTLGASVLENMLAGKRVIIASGRTITGATPSFN